VLALIGVLPGLAAGEGATSHIVNRKLACWQEILESNTFVAIAYPIPCGQRGLNSKRGPRSFHPLLLLQKIHFAPKVRQMSLTWESFAGENIKLMKSSQYGTTTKVLDIHVIMPCLAKCSVLLFFITQCL
jgi:hypothetical protein